MFKMFADYHVMAKHVALKPLCGNMLSVRQVQQPNSIQVSHINKTHTQVDRVKAIYERNNQLLLVTEAYIFRLKTAIK